MQRKQGSLITWLGSRSLLVSLVLLAIIYVISKYHKRMTIKERLMSVLQRDLSPITAAFAFAQAAHETGNFTSPLYFSNNNCFGMKMPKIRPTTADKELFGYAHYTSIEKSAEDYLLWFRFAALPTGLSTIDQFITGLYTKNYFEAPLKDYLSGVRHFYNLYFQS